MQQSSTASRASITHPAGPHFVTPAFEGPLDLLLHLIRANQVDIYDIPIAEITRQYLDYIALLEELDLTIAGEYILIAATLVEIKSRMLLPAPPPAPGEEEPEDPRAELVARLLEYQQYQGTVETLRTWEELRRQVFFRGSAASPDDYILPVPEGEATVGQLLAALHRVLTASGLDEKPVTSVVPRRRLSLKLKMAEVARRTTAAGAQGLPFDSLFELPCPRYDLVITFLALLELLRARRVRADQAGPLEPITLYAIESEETETVAEATQQNTSDQS
jgi:segregation and condensation protein A